MLELLIITGKIASIPLTIWLVIVLIVLFKTAKENQGEITISFKLEGVACFILFCFTISCWFV